MRTITSCQTNDHQRNATVFNFLLAAPGSVFGTMENEASLPSKPVEETISPNPVMKPTSEPQCQSDLKSLPPLDVVINQFEEWLKFEPERFEDFITNYNSILQLTEEVWEQQSLESENANLRNVHKSIIVPLLEKARGVFEQEISSDSDLGSYLGQEWNELMLTSLKALKYSKTAADQSSGSNAPYLKLIIKYLRQASETFSETHHPPTHWTRLGTEGIPAALNELFVHLPRDLCKPEEMDFLDRSMSMLMNLTSTLPKGSLSLEARLVRWAVLHLARLTDSMMRHKAAGLQNMLDDEAYQLLGGAFPRHHRATETSDPDTMDHVVEGESSRELSETTRRDLDENGNEVDVDSSTRYQTEGSYLSSDSESGRSTPESIASLQRSATATYSFDFTMFAETMTHMINVCSDSVKLSAHSRALCREFSKITSNTDHQFLETIRSIDWTSQEDIAKLNGLIIEVLKPHSDAEDRYSEDLLQDCVKDYSSALTELTDNPSLLNDLWSRSVYNTGFDLKDVLLTFVNANNNSRLYRQMISFRAKCAKLSKQISGLSNIQALNNVIEDLWERRTNIPLNITKNDDGSWQSILNEEKEFQDKFGNRVPSEKPLWADHRIPYFMKNWYVDDAKYALQNSHTYALLSSPSKDSIPPREFVDAVRGVLYDKYDIVEMAKEKLTPEKCLEILHTATFDLACIIPAMSHSEPNWSTSSESQKLDPTSLPPLSSDRTVLVNRMLEFSRSIINRFDRATNKSLFPPLVERIMKDSHTTTRFKLLQVCILWKTYSWAEPKVEGGPGPYRYEHFEGVEKCAEKVYAFSNLCNTLVNDPNIQDPRFIVLGYCFLQEFAEAWMCERELPSLAATITKIFQEKILTHQKQKRSSQ